jgi:mono/diheme cytochrome c family protein
MSMRRTLLAAIPLAFVSGAAIAADSPGLGQPISEADIKNWDISIGPDGVGLPPGSGTAVQGAAIYVQKCEPCHGKEGKGATNTALVGGIGCAP